MMKMTENAAAEAKRLDLDFHGIEKVLGDSIYADLAT